jgi:Uma2 family endonuclease
MSAEITANKLTYEHYELFPDDGNRHEVIDGSHYMTPSPNLNHQKVLGRIQHFFYTEIELKNLGWIYQAPTDVVLSEFDIVQPDLTIVLNDRKSILTDANIAGVPNMVVEVLSPKTEKYDRTLKMQLYQQAGIPEYWIVDIRNQRIEQYVLVNSQFAMRKGDDNITLTIVTNVEFETSKLWHGL